jgi:hypothetical protein
MYFLLIFDIEKRIRLLILDAHLKVAHALLEVLAQILQLLVHCGILVYRLLDNGLEYCKEDFIDIPVLLQALLEIDLSVTGYMVDKQRDSVDHLLDSLELLFAPYAVLGSPHQYIRKLLDPGLVLLDFEHELEQLEVECADPAVAA